MCKEKQESYDKPRQCVKKQRRHFAGKSPLCQGYGISSSHYFPLDSHKVVRSRP